MAQQVKNLPAIQETQETQIWSLVQEDPLEEENGNPLQYSCLGNSMDRGSMEGYAPWGHKELDTTEVTQHTLMHLLYVSLFSKCLKRSCCPVWKHSLYWWIGLTPHRAAGQPSPPVPPHLGLWISVSSRGRLTDHRPPKTAALSDQGHLFEFCFSTKLWGFCFCFPFLIIFKF